jgi:hypothetical protein
MSRSPSGVLHVRDDAGGEVVLDAVEAAALWRIADGLEPATVSACSSCRCRVVAAVALVDLLDTAPPLRATSALCELADEAPTLHLYVVDVGVTCPHPGWRDPLAEEWAEVVHGRGRTAIR